MLVATPFLSAWGSASELSDNPLQNTDPSFGTASNQQVLTDNLVTIEQYKKENAYLNLLILEKDKIIANKSEVIARYIKIIDNIYKTVKILSDKK